MIFHSQIITVSSLPKGMGITNPEDGGGGGGIKCLVQYNATMIHTLTCSHLFCLFASLPHQYLYPQQMIQSPS